MKKGYFRYLIRLYWTQWTIFISFCNFMSNQFYIASNLFLIKINSKKCLHERLKFDNDQRLTNLDRFLYYSYAHVTSIQEVSTVRNSKIANVCFSYWLHCIVERSFIALQYSHLDIIFQKGYHYNLYIWFHSYVATLL